MSTIELSVAAIRTDGGTQVRASLHHERLEDYAEAMRNGAKFPPVDVYLDDEGYWLADGFHRVEAARRAGRPTLSATVHESAEMPGPRAALLHAVGCNATHGVPRTNEDKRRAVRILLEDPEWGGWANRRIADKCNVSDWLVARLRDEVTSSPCSDGPQVRTYVDKHGNVSTMDTTRIGASSSPLVLPGEYPVDAGATGLEMSAAAAEERRREQAREVIHSSKTNEHYTPPHVIELVREFMGAIDLDPASCEEANKIVRAGQYYTESDDGLSLPWFGRDFNNPPYGIDEDYPVGDPRRSRTCQWVMAMNEKYDAGEFDEGCQLVASATGQVWFRPLWQRPLCFVHGRLQFIDADGNPQTSPTGSHVIVGYTRRIREFCEVFSRIGRVVPPEDAYTLREAA